MYLCSSSGSCCTVYDLTLTYRPFCFASLIHSLLLHISEHCVRNSLLASCCATRVILTRTASLLSISACLTCALSSASSAVLVVVITRHGLARATDDRFPSSTFGIRIVLASRSHAAIDHGIHMLLYFVYYR